jgi:hypothetical protein
LFSGSTIVSNGSPKQKQKYLIRLRLMWIKIYYIKQL